VKWDNRTVRHSFLVKCCIWNINFNSAAANCYILLTLPLAAAVQFLQLTRILLDLHSTKQWVLLSLTQFHFAISCFPWPHRSGSSLAFCFVRQLRWHASSSVTFPHISSLYLVSCHSLLLLPSVSLNIESFLQWIRCAHCVPLHNIFWRQICYIFNYKQSQNMIGLTFCKLIHCVSSYDFQRQPFNLSIYYSHRGKT